ncbi:hypothetical protein ES703_50704 [subsurface metagenome]
MLINTEKFIENDIHYIKYTYSNGSTETIPDPDFQNSAPFEKPPLPTLSTVNQKLDFIIDELGLKNRFAPPE